MSDDLFELGERIADLAARINLSNGAPRFVDSAVPLRLELEALEAVA